MCLFCTIEILVQITVVQFRTLVTYPNTISSFAYALQKMLAFSDALLAFLVRSLVYAVVCGASPIGRLKLKTTMKPDLL